MAQITSEIEEKDLVAEVLLDVEEVDIQEMPIFITISPESETTEFESIFNPEAYTPEIEPLPSSNGYKV